MGRGCRPHRRRIWYSTFAPFPDTRRRNQPALAQTYATVVFREGRVSGEQMLTVGRGLRTTATAAVGPAKVHKATFQLTHCQDWVLLQQTTRALCQHAGVVTLRHTKPGPIAKREIQGRVSSGGAASFYQSRIGSRMRSIEWRHCP